uniref:Bm3343 n=2 Tax=Bursaphelenchus xylophilus TaxID=6326 RepID=A0A1I7SMG9_BURXY
MGHQRRPSVAKAAQHAYVNPTAPIILFIGGPGGGKTKYAAKVRDALENKGLVHICVPDLIKDAIKRYKTVYPEWKEASRKYDRGELISNDLIQMLVKAEMGRYPNANAYFLEGFPREAKQVEDFEKNVRNVNLAMILDYDEETLRTHMMNRGLDREVIDRRINEFRNKTLPSAKYFDDHRLLYLIPGEKDDNVILDRMKKLVKRAMESGVSMVAKHPAATSKGQGDSTTSSREPSPSLPSAKRKVKSRATTDENPNPQGVEVLESSTSKGSETELNTERDKDTARPTTTDTTARSKPQTPATPGVSKNKSLSRVATNESIHTTTTPGEAEQNSFENNTQNGENTNRRITREVSKANLSQSQSRPSTSKSKESRPGTGTDGVIRQNPASKPPTRTGSRPATSASKKSTSANSRPPSVPKTPAAEENDTIRPPTTAVEMEKLPEENVVDPTAEANVRLLSASTVSRLPSAADRFPKGLPNNAPVILILGAPGSNKKEMAEKVAKKYEGFVHISMGDLLRKKVNDNPEDELWIRVGKKMEAGEQIPMKICREILYSTVHEMGNRSWGYVIEGYPRTLAQAEDIESQLGRLDVAILLDCTEQFCKDNINKRFEEAKETGNARLDDDEQSLKQKLALFKQNTLPMLKHLDEKKKLRVVEGDGPVDRLFSTVTELMDSTVFANDGKTNVPEVESRDLRTAGSVAS